MDVAGLAVAGVGAAGLAGLVVAGVGAEDSGAVAAGEEIEEGSSHADAAAVVAAVVAADAGVAAVGGVDWVQRVAPRSSLSRSDTLASTW